MKLKKNKWKSLTLDEACTFVRGVVFSTKDEVDSGGYAILRSHNVDFENSKVSLHNLKYVSDTVKVKDSQKLMKDDILISVANSKEQTGKVGFCNEDTNSYAGGFMAILKPKETIHPFYLFNYLLSNESKDFIAGRTQGTTNIFNITFERIKDLEIPLPPLYEQKLIAALFQSIEMAIEKVDGQEKNLKALQKSMVNGLLSKEPRFGDLLNSKNCTSTTFGEITECDKKYPEHEKEVDRFVGLEWIEADNFQLQGFGLVANGTTFTKRFCKGDVMFGKRRAYLKKVAVADFDGICSSDILVIRAKAKKLLQGLLPYYISSDAFIQHAVSTSAGSLSPRTKWKDLAELQVSFPDLKKQQKILEVLQQLDSTVNQLKRQKTTLKNLKQKLLNEILG
ncbi:MAG: restriction endonuclease subunit S [Saprospiraceae bacterium]|nr:restriction endonuclease subunit S [Candidatus Defluviibacterium haderslevense]